VIGAIVLIIGGCVTTCAVVVTKKAKSYQHDAQASPQLAALSLAAAAYPGIVVAAKDRSANTITLRNPTSGQTLTLDLNDLSSDQAVAAMERFAEGPRPSQPAAMASPAASASPIAEHQPPGASSTRRTIGPARAAQNSTLKKFPDFIPVYPAAKTMEASLNSFSGTSIGSTTFASADAPDKIAEFYEKKLTGAGFTVLTKSSGSDDRGATASLILQRPDPQAAVTVSAEIENGETHVTIGFTQTGNN
jgi:hypothetical protein